MKVGVVLCCYNGQKYIKEQLNSIINQDYLINEIIILDDCSTDLTRSILKEYDSHENISLYFNSSNLGVVKNFEQGLIKSKSDIIFFSDQDDIWTRHKVSTVVNFYESNPEILAVFSDAYIINELDNANSNSLWDCLDFDYNLQKLDFFEYLIRNGNVVTGAGLSVKAEVKKDILPFPKKTIFQHDERIALRLAQQKKIYPLNEKLFYYRIHLEQQLGVPTKKIENKSYNLFYFYKVYFRSKLMYQLTKSNKNLKDQLLNEFLCEKRKYLKNRGVFVSILTRIKWSIERRYEL